MRLKTILIFFAAAGLSLLAAHHRFLDSAHSIGMLKAGGGSARHPVILEPGHQRYTLIATAAVIPPYRGDAEVVLEGLPGMDYAIYNNDPVIDLTPYRKPVFRDHTLYGLQPRDRIALWVVMQPKAGMNNARPSKSDVAGPARLAFYDVDSRQSLLNVPIVFGAEGGGEHAGH